jgi:hypothetical protein
MISNCIFLMARLNSVPMFSHERFLRMLLFVTLEYSQRPGMEGEHHFLALAVNHVLLVLVG